MIKRMLFGLVGVALACEASAIMIKNPGGLYDSWDVGSVDTFVGQTGAKGKISVGVGKLSNSNPETESKWANGLSDTELNYVSKTENVQYFLTDTANVFAFALKSDPSHYVIKNSTFWALFENVQSNGWAVFDASSLNGGFNMPDYKSLKISHVTEFSSVSAVPVPSSLLLFSAALLGCGYIRRRSTKV